MKSIMRNTLITAMVCSIGACTVNRTGETFNEWEHVDEVSKVVFEKLQSPLWRSTGFGKEYVAVSNIKIRVRNTSDMDKCVRFSLRDMDNVGFHGNYKKGELVKAGEVVKVGTVYVTDNDRDAVYTSSYHAYRPRNSMCHK